MEDTMSATKTPKGYVIGMISVTDMDAYKPYMAQTAALVAEYGGRYLVRGAEQDLKENTPPHDRLVVIEFDSHDQANAFYHDDRYAEVRKIRQANSDGFIFTIGGYAG